MSVESMARALRIQGLTSAQKLILVGIANHDGDGGAWPKVDTLALYACVSHRQAQKVIASLEELGFIEREINGGGSKRTPDAQRPNLYRLRLDTRVAEDATPLSPTPSPPLSPTTPETSTTILETPAAKLKEEFKEWYNIYPQKKAPLDAERAYGKARKMATKEELLAGAQRVLDKHRTEPHRKKFISHPATWLNAGCWEDEVEVEPDVGGRPAELFAETAQFFTKYASRVPHEKIVATIAALLKNGYGEGETMMRLGVQAALWPEGLAIPNTVMKIPVTVVPRFQGRARQWDDMPDEPYAALIERAWRGRKWLCQK